MEEVYSLQKLKDIREKYRGVISNYQASFEFNLGGYRQNNMSHGWLQKRQVQGDSHSHIPVSHSNSNYAQRHTYGIKERTKSVTRGEVYDPLSKGSTYEATKKSLLDYKSMTTKSNLGENLSNILYSIDNKITQKQRLITEMGKNNQNAFRQHHIRYKEIPQTVTRYNSCKQLGLYDAYVGKIHRNVVGKDDQIQNQRVQAKMIDTSVREVGLQRYSSMQKLPLGCRQNNIVSGSQFFSNKQKLSIQNSFQRKLKIDSKQNSQNYDVRRQLDEKYSNGLKIHQNKNHKKDDSVQRNDNKNIVDTKYNTKTIQADRPGWNLSKLQNIQNKIQKVLQAQQ